MEHWKDVIGYEGLYQVSDRGKVRSVDRMVQDSRGRNRKLKGKVLSPILREQGIYKCLAVNLSQNGSKRQEYIHRLVLAAFVGVCPEDMECCHNDGNGLNNLLVNLRWDTAKANFSDAISHGTRTMPILSTPVRRGDGVRFETQNEAARKSGCHQQSISAVCLGKQKTAGGYTWERIA